MFPWLIQSNLILPPVNLSLFERDRVRFGSGQIPKGNEGIPNQRAAWFWHDVSLLDDIVGHCDLTARLDR